MKSYLISSSGIDPLLEGPFLEKFKFYISRSLWNLHQKTISCGINEDYRLLLMQCLMKQTYNEMREIPSVGNLCKLVHILADKSMQ